MPNPTKRRGRPPFEHPRTQSIRIWVSAEEMARVDRKIEAEGTTRSEYGRKVILGSLEKESK